MLTVGTRCRISGNGEFYTNFGSYDVAITVPGDHLVAATGVLMNPEDVLDEGRAAGTPRCGTADDVDRDDPRVERSGRREVATAGESQTDVEIPRRRCALVRVASASSPAFIWDACSTGGVLVAVVLPARGSLDVGESDR
jgi:hypothetical protein